MSAPRRLGPFEDWTEAVAWVVFAFVGAYFGYQWLIWLL